MNYWSLGELGLPGLVDLQPEALHQILGRARSAGVMAMEVGLEDMPPQYLPYVSVHRGIVYYNMAADADTLVHELSHAVEMQRLGLLRRHDAYATGADFTGHQGSVGTRNEEDVVMPCQVALCGRIETLGVESAIGWMVSVGYGIVDCFDEDEDGTQLSPQQAGLNWWNVWGRPAARSLNLPWKWE